MPWAPATGDVSSGTVSRAFPGDRFLTHFLAVQRSEGKARPSSIHPRLSVPARLAGWTQQQFELGID
jgi:hypothetical protein